MCVCVQSEYFRNGVKAWCENFGWSFPRQYKIPMLLDPIHHFEKCTGNQSIAFNCIPITMFDRLGLACDAFENLV